MEGAIQAEFQGNSEKGLADEAERMVEDDMGKQDTQISNCPRLYTIT